MTDNLVTRLRNSADHNSRASGSYDKKCLVEWEAADRIEQLEARIVTLVDKVADYDGRIEKLEAALREVATDYPHMASFALNATKEP